MPATRPAFTVVSNSPLGDELRQSVAELSGRLAHRCSYEDSRSQLVWDRPGLVILVAADEDDWGPLTSLAREVTIRQSPLKVVIAHRPGLGGYGVLHQLAPLSAARLPWPTAAEELIATVRAADGATSDLPEESMADRLLSLTPSLAPLAERLIQAAAYDLTVLLTGETGTGKTFIARLLHDFSPRQKHPFLMVPCGSQSPNLFESCFFGHVKGAFTGAHQAQRGKFAAAGKGTILLDEIDTLGLEQQASLLRVIETDDYEQVGGHVTLKNEARIIAASNRDLGEAVDAGRLRQDLYYRINVLSFHLPALRQRPQDIGPLSRHFTAHFSTRFDKPLCGIAPDAMGILESFPWPGNIRQMENIIQGAVLGADGSELRACDLLTELNRHGEFAMPAPAAPGPIIDRRVAAVNGHRPAASLLQSRADYERHLIRKTLEECRFNRSSAARVLGVSRVTLHKKIKQYGLVDRS